MYKEEEESGFGLVAASLSEHPNLVEEKKVHKEDYNDVMRYYESKLKE